MVAVREGGMTRYYIVMSTEKHAVFEAETSRTLKNFMSKTAMVEREKILSYKNVC